MTTLDIHLMDEAPRIGSGWRVVEVLSVGPKWARVRYKPMGIRHRFKRSVWDQIMKTAKPRGD